MTPDSLAALVAEYGLLILAPLAMLEGPIVTVIAAYLTQWSLLDLPDVIVCVILADLAGDCLLYLFGRYGLHALPSRARARVGLSPRRLVRLTRGFRSHGTRMLVLGKITHAAGFAVLIASGTARMPFVPFFLANLVATVPKSLVFVALGRLFGSAHARIGDWLPYASAGLTALVAAGLCWHLLRLRKRSAA